MTVPAAPLEPARLTEIEEWAYEQGLTPEQGASHPVADLLGHIAYLEAENEQLADAMLDALDDLAPYANAFDMKGTPRFEISMTLRQFRAVLARHAGRRG